MDDELREMFETDNAALTPLAIPFNEDQEIITVFSRQGSRFQDPVMDPYEELLIPQLLEDLLMYRGGGGGGGGVGGGGRQIYREPSRILPHASTNFTEFRYNQSVQGHHRPREIQGESQRRLVGPEGQRHRSRQALEGTVAPSTRGTREEQQQQQEGGEERGESFPSRHLEQDVTFPCDYEWRK